MNQLKAHTINVIALTAAPLFMICGYFQYETGLFNYYQVPLVLLQIPFWVWLFSACVLLVVLATIRLFPAFFLSAARYPLLIILPVAVVILCRYAGHIAASAKTSYTLSSAHKNFLIIEQYDDLLILKDYDPKTRRLGNKLLIEGMHSDNFQVSETGSLKESPVLN